MRLREHLEKLNYYVAVVEAGSMRQASEVVLIGQPQLTKVVMYLEDLLGAQLLIRSRQGVVPTKEGDQLYRFSKQLLDSADQFEFGLKSEGRRLAGVVTIGTYDSISRYFFPGFIKYLKGVAPQLDVSLLTGRSQDLIKKVRRGEVDLSVFVGECQKPNIKSQVVYLDSFGLFHSKGLEAQFLETLIYFPDAVGEAPLPTGAGRFKYFHRCGNLETVVSLVGSGLGVGLLPRRVAQEPMVSGKFVEVHGSQTKGLHQHPISVALNTKTESEVSAFVYDEILRFLGIWSGKSLEV